MQWQIQYLNLFFLCFFGISSTTNNFSQCGFLSNCSLSMFCQLVNCSHTVYEHSHGIALYVRSDRETHPFGMPLNMAALFEQALSMPKEREGEFMGDLLLPLWQFWFWQTFFEYRMSTNVETQMNGAWASIFYSKSQVFSWGRAELMPWAPTSSKVPIFYYQLIISLFHMNWFLSHILW